MLYSSNSRKSNTIRNVLYAWSSQVIIIFMNMVVRIFFVRILSKEYLGLGGLFSNVISILSLAELGIGSAIIYSLYEPLAKNDKEQISCLMLFYKRVYILIGTLIGIIGISISPFLQYFIKDMPNIEHLRIIYLLFVLNSSVSYFFSYKASLISADQKDYILKKVRIKVNLLMYILQIIALILTKNYILFLSVQVLATVLQNLICNHIVNKLYPYLKRYRQNKINPKALHQIWKNTKALILHKVGSIAVFSTDNLIISKFTGLSNVAIFSNYTLIQDALNTILTQLFSAMAASVGNLTALESENKAYEIFERILFLNFWVYSFCSISFLCLSQDFIELFFGSDYLISPLILLILTINFYLNGMRKSVMTFRDAYGLFWQNRYMPIIEAVFNLAISLLLVKTHGMLGVLSGTTISTILMPVWVEPLVLFRNGFHKGLFVYWKAYVKYILLFMIAGICTFWICSRVIYIPGISLIVKAILCMIVPNILFLFIFKGNVNFQYYLNLIKNARKRDV